MEILCWYSRKTAIVGITQSHTGNKAHDPYVLCWLLIYELSVVMPGSSNTNWRESERNEKVGYKSNQERVKGL